MIGRLGEEERVKMRHSRQAAGGELGRLVNVCGQAAGNANTIFDGLGVFT